MKKELARFSEVQPEVDAVRGEALRRAVDVHALKVAVALDDALARGVVGVTLVPYLRGRGGMVGVAVLVGQRVAARNRTRVGALHLGERFAHQPEAHVHGVAQALGLALGVYQSVKLVVGVGVAEGTAQRFLLLFLAGIGAAYAVRTAAHYRYLVSRSALSPSSRVVT